MWLSSMTKTASRERVSVQQGCSPADGFSRAPCGCALPGAPVIIDQAHFCGKQGRCVDMLTIFWLF
jgi:hypothetical protein